MQYPSRLLRCCAFVCLFAIASYAENSPAPNSDATYQQLRNLGLSGEAVSVSNLALRRDAATFHLRSGTVCFVRPVEGKVTGAVFVGDGNMILDPPLATERSTLKLLTKSDEFTEVFSHLVLRFTDSTYEDIRKNAATSSASCDPSLLPESQKVTRKTVRYNLDARILADVLSSEPGGLFVAFVHGQRYSSKIIFAIDPHGAPPFAEEVYRDYAYALPLAPEEVELMTYDENKHGYWASFHFSSEYSNGLAKGSQKNAVIHIDHQQLDTAIEKNASLSGKAQTTVVSQVNGLRVVPFNLFSRLRVQSVNGEDGKPLSFIQEDKNEDYQFFVIVPRTLSSGEKYTITTTYGGKEAVFNEGGGNYIPVSRDDWYPNNASSSLGEYTAYDLTFRIPKGMKMAATGTLVSENNEGGQNVTTWKSEVPLTVAGFNFGRFKVEQATIDKPPYLVQSYANEDPPDWVKRLQHMVDDDLPSLGSHMSTAALGVMNTTPLIKKALAEGEMAISLYSDYYGPAPYKRVAITQQTSCNFGQSWPGLVWIPMCYFFDTTVRHQLGMDFGDHGYWKIVTPHEVAHQWWGHTVGFNSYRDQWMSEGFAEMSASLYLQMVEKNPQKFIDFWNDERQLLLDRDAEGWRAIDAGPVTMGYRMSNTRTGGAITRRLIYPKGAYILHMIRMMMWNPTVGDGNFKSMMQDFVQTYANHAATTEDFKAMVEKHMTPDMDLDGNHKMDWFFDEYVYGTALPSYHLDYSFEKDADGNVVIGFKATQSNVGDKFKMLVPIYLEFADGHTATLGRVRLVGNASVEHKVPIKGLKETPRRAVLNHFDDVLASP